MQERAAGRRLGSWGIAGASAGLLAIGLLGATVAGATTAATGATITPAHGKPFVPTLGDWEGTVDGFPASFQLVNARRPASQPQRPPYGFNDMVILRPTTCTPSPGHHAEDSFTATRPPALDVHGGFGLSSFGVGGGITGARSASITQGFKVKGPGKGSGGCSGRLVWHLHPSQRVPVRDGHWKAHFAGGSSAFQVSDGGRLATGLRIPSALGSCGGPVGAVDLFIAPSGNAIVRQAKLTVRLHFAGRKAGGTLSTPKRRCGSHSLKLTAAG